MCCSISPISSCFVLSMTFTWNETKYTQYIPLVEEGKEVLSTLVLETRTKVDCSNKNFDGVFEVEDVVEVEVKARDKIIQNNVVNEGRSSFESVSSNVGTNEAVRKETERKRKIACKLLEQRDVMEGEERMDSLWEIYALLDMTKSAQKADHVLVEKKKKRTRELDPYYGKEDDDVQMRNWQPGCLPFKLCARKLNLRKGRTQIVKITKALKGIDLLPLHHVTKRRAWQKKQILI